MKWGFSKFNSFFADDDCHFRKVVYIFKHGNGTTVSFFLGSDAKGVTQFHYIFFIFVDDDCYLTKLTAMYHI